MKKKIAAMALAACCLWGQTTQAVTFNLVTGVLQDENGNPLPDDSTILFIASTSNSTFGALTSPSSASDTVFLNEPDDVIIARFPMNSASSGQAGINVIVTNFTLGASGTAANNPLMLVWYSGLLESGSPAAPGQGRSFGTYRTDSVVDGSSSGWVMPGSDGATISLNMNTVAAGGSLAETEGLADQITFAPAANVPPTAICQNVTNSASGSCTAAVTPAQVDNGSTDSDGTIVTRTLTPAGPYALGDTPVTLTVIDDGGASNTCSAVVTVIDTTDPTVTCPANIVTNVDIGQTEIVVNYSAPSASDACSNPVTVDSVPASGSTFPIGVNTVNVTAVDAAGNTNTCSFTITVNGAGLGGCISQLDALTGLTDGRKNSLLNSLTKAQEKFNAGKTRQGCAKLRAFIIRAQVYKRVGILDTPTADALIACVQAQQVANGCP